MEFDTVLVLMHAQTKNAWNKPNHDQTLFSCLMFASVSSFNPLCFFFQTPNHFKVAKKLFAIQKSEDNDSECDSMVSFNPPMIREITCMKKLFFWNTYEETYYTFWGKKLITLANWIKPMLLLNVQKKKKNICCYFSAYSPVEVVTSSQSDEIY